MIMMLTIEKLGVNSIHWAYGHGIYICTYTDMKERKKYENSMGINKRLEAIDITNERVLVMLCSQTHVN